VSGSADRWAWSFGALLLAVGALWLATLHLAGLDLGPDEAQYWWWSRDVAWGYFSKPPLIAWLIALTTAVCGDTAFCVRLASPVLHLVTATILVLVGRTLESPARST
jgi:4-amino-4-deoxy-L-arabinose transferase-like glycosyltransferase